GASVSIGGDVAVAGAAPQPGSWLIGVADPTDLDVEASQLALVWGGVATSGTLRRRWRDRDGAMVHHLLDPATRRPAHHHREIVAATVIAGTAAWAEVWTKAVMVRGVMMLPVLDRFALGAQVTYADTATTVNTTWSNFAVSGQRGDPVGDVTGMVEA
ncbi:MAG: FAD:protein FMN transferase, partial [Ilumatobacteraceae bacterium]